MAERVPAQATPPGDFIRDELEARGWTQLVLADVMGRPLQFVNELLAGRKGVTPESATGLAAAFGTSAELWMNLDAAYRLWLLRQKEAKEGSASGEIARRAKLYEIAPVKDMIRRRWIPEPSSADELESSLNRFFGCKVLEEETCLPIAARKSTQYGDDTPAQKAWAFRARHLAKGVGAARFGCDTFARGLNDLRKLLSHEASVRHVPKMLAELGVRLVIVEHLPKSMTDGAALWLEGEPVIAISFRYDRIDGFWFTLAHEIAHVLHSNDDCVDTHLVGADAVATDAKPDVEKRADAWAANFLLDSGEIDRFITRVKPYYSKVRINQFANRVKVHPGIIVGQLQRRKEIPYSHNREMLVKVRDAIAGSAMVDGWGSAPLTG